MVSYLIVSSSFSSQWRSLSRVHHHCHAVIKCTYHALSSWNPGNKAKAALYHQAISVAFLLFLISIYAQLSSLYLEVAIKYA